ncbi:DUF432 domain-containing protein [Thermococcus sp. M36]|uniref:DUF432 domain-containing protein n=1 Tax=Thermococcus sp. M36 TaxID=1638261 RepID=UPI0014391E8E|nr:DUF432 domain-containing protein [Thermococcus sp. M36]NJE05822.1 DUF432 domain-containing protein [Thermococcus sp. M36]
MFGEHELRTKFIKVVDRKIHLVERPGGTVLYRRDDVRVLIKRGDESLMVLPAPAEGYGVGFLMIKLREKIALPPRERITGYLTAPIDITIRSGDTEIDRFVVGKEKYALYGRITSGVIARYHTSGFYTEVPEAPGVVKLVIDNPTEKWKLVEKVVIPIKGSTMFYSREKAYYPLVVLTTREPYEVNNTGNPPDGTLRKTHEAEPVPNFRMRW